MRLKLGDEISLEVLSTEEIKSLTFLAVSRNDIVLSKTVDVPNSKSFNFKFRSTPAMMPQAYLVAYYIRNDGEIVSHRLTLDLEYELSNTVS